MWIQREIALRPRPRGIHLVGAEIGRAPRARRRARRPPAPPPPAHLRRPGAEREREPGRPRRPRAVARPRRPRGRATTGGTRSKGADDMPAHVKSVLTGSSVTLPIADGTPRARHLAGDLPVRVPRPRRPAARDRDAPRRRLGCPRAKRVVHTCIRVRDERGVACGSTSCSASSAAAGSSSTPPTTSTSACPGEGDDARADRERRAAPSPTTSATGYNHLAITVDDLDAAARRARRARDRAREAAVRAGRARGRGPDLLRRGPRRLPDRAHRRRRVPDPAGPAGPRVRLVLSVALSALAACGNESDATFDHEGFPFDAQVQPSDPRAPRSGSSTTCSARSIPASTRGLGGGRPPR